MIKDRKPTEILDQTMPMVEHDVICLSCRVVWLLERQIGRDYRFAKCPICGERNAELRHEAPGWYTTIH